MPTLLLYGSLLECGGGTSIHYSFFLFYLYRASKRCVSPLRRDRLHVQFRFCGSTARQTVNELFFLLISCIGPAIDRSVPCCLSISTNENPAHVASRDCFTALQPQQMTSRPDFTFSRDLRRPCSSLSLTWSRRQCCRHDSTSLTQNLNLHPLSLYSWEIVGVSGVRTWFFSSSALCPFSWDFSFPFKRGEEEEEEKKKIRWGSPSVVLFPRLLLSRSPQKGKKKKSFPSFLSFVCYYTNTEREREEPQTEITSKRGGISLTQKKKRREEVCRRHPIANSTETFSRFSRHWIRQLWRTCRRVK